MLFFCHNRARLCFVVMLAAAIALLPDMASAQEVIGKLLCGLVGWFYGPVGRGIATLAIIIVGVGALLGKVSWGMAIIVGLGVAVVFGAGTITEELAAPATNQCQGWEIPDE